MTDYTQIKSINEVEQHTLRLQRKASIQQNKIQKDINNIRRKSVCHRHYNKVGKTKTIEAFSHKRY